LSNISVLSRAGSNQKVMVIAETRCELLLFKQRPVRIEAFSRNT
jgi:hypothetical protein